MGLLHRQAIGMEISHGGIAGVLVAQRAESATLLRATRVPLPQGCLSHNLKEPQVLQPDGLVRAVREAWGSLHLGTRQIALSLPDSAGHLLVTTLEEPWKHHADAAEILRWKLGKRLGIAPDLLQLDFQLLERHQNGATDLLVALIHRHVVLQYEELLLESGLQPVRIGLHTPHLLRLFDRFKAGAGQIITLYDHALGTTAQTGQRLVFCRVKQLPDDAGPPDRLRHELAASLAASRQASGGTIPGPCYLMAPPDDSSLTSMLTATLGEPPHQLRLETVVMPDAGLSLPASQLFRVSAAVGAALGGS